LFLCREPTQKWNRENEKLYLDGNLNFGSISHTKSKETLFKIVWFQASNLETNEIKSPHSRENIYSKGHNENQEPGIKVEKLNGTVKMYSNCIYPKKEEYSVYFLRDPPVTTSVMKTISSFCLLSQALMNWIIFGCLSFFNNAISSAILFLSSKEKYKKNSFNRILLAWRFGSLITFQATS